MDFSSAYLTKQIIAYIGNKRKLLPLIYRAIQQTGMEVKPGIRFLDLFAGSGVVSRLAKSLNFEVFCNDWEYYASVINSGYIQTNASDIPRLFGSAEAFSELIGHINSLPEPEDSRHQYIAHYYAPSSFNIDDADFKTERLFYTRTNALAIDKIRNFIQRKYETRPDFNADAERRNILLSELLYEAATHTNTSGVFKACHKGFGGHNRDALKRILAPIRLQLPVLIDSSYPVHIFRENANTLIRHPFPGSVDIAYLDPPYNQHQYGSNYHLLNTIAKWDHIPAPLDINEKGELREKAAIRHDWVKTKSDYCYRKIAESAFEDLINNLQAKHILISYSTDGIIPFETMQRICMQRGRLSIVTNEYTTFRGGRQSNTRLNTNIEFILCIDTTAKQDERAAELIDSVLVRKKLLLLFRQKFSAERLKQVAENVEDSRIFLKIGNKHIAIESDNLFELIPPQNSDSLSVKELEKIHALLAPCACTTREQELTEILSRINGNSRQNIQFIKRIPGTLKKLASKKNRDVFRFWLKKIRETGKTHPDLYALIQDKIDATEKLAEVRFAS